MAASRPVTRRRLLQGTGAAALAAAWPISRAQSRVSLRFSSSMVADQNAAHFVWYEQLQAGLKASVGNAIKIDYFPNNQLGKESDVVQQVKVGSVDMMVSGSSIFATICPELGMLDLGYLFDNYAHVAKVLDGPTGTTLNEMLQKSSGCTILTWASHFGPRSVYTKNQVKSLAEVKGVKLRVLPTPAFIETFKIMGAIPTPIPFGELYMAAQTGVVDGFEHDAATVLASKLNEVTKSCWMTEHLFSPMVVVISRRSQEKIPAAAADHHHHGAEEVLGHPARFGHLVELAGQHRGRVVLEAVDHAGLRRHVQLAEGNGRGDGAHDLEGLDEGRRGQHAQLHALHLGQRLHLVLGVDAARAEVR